MRAWGAGFVAAATAVLACVLPAPAAAANPPVSAQLLTTSQANMLRLGYVRVRVQSRRSATIRLWSTARRSPRGRAYQVTRSTLLRLRGPRSRVVRLRLNAAGRRILARCVTASVAPVARARLRGRRTTTRLGGPPRAVLSARCRSGDRPGLPGVGLAAPDPDPAPLGPVAAANADRCDFLDPAVCLFPWPNDRFTNAANTPTGRQLDLSSESVPKNTKGSPIDPTDQNRADGFSPGNLIVTKVPGLDSQAAFDSTGAVPVTDMARSFDPAQPVVVINARTKQRHLIWAEIDSNPTDPADVSLIIRPGRNFEEGERYVVALRNLKKADGSAIAPREEFRAYRDDLTTANPGIESRRAHHEQLFRTLAEAGIARRELYLTWDFTVASRQSLSDRALSMRDDAFRQLGDTNLADSTIQGRAPTFVQNPNIDDGLTEPLPDVPLFDFKDLDGYREYTVAENPNTARRITGQITVPCYLDAPGCPPGSSFNLDSEGKPQQLGVTTANVICTIPRSAVDASAGSPLARASLYGHGLLGSAGEVGGSSAQPFGQAKNIVFCATDWAGMSTFDVPNVLTLLQDLSNFRSLVDRSQQGFVNFMYLGRWLSHPQGAAALEAFKIGGRSVIDADERLVYDGNSQGGILAGGLTALSPDFDRAVHGVPGMNYSTLLRRSVDFDTYANGNFEGVPSGAGLYQSYPDELERPLVLSMMQLLWDRGEANGYAHHMTGDPLPGTQPHQVLLHPAFGDHQVANVAADVEARTLGARAYRPALVGGRSPDVTPLYDVPTAPAGRTGSGIVYWDTGPLRDGGAKGTPAPPTGNVPPRLGNDPHSAPRKDPKSWDQKSDFLRNTGTLTNPCGLGPCYAEGFTGP